MTVAALVALGACAPRAAKPPTPTQAFQQPAPEEVLRRDLRALIHDPAVEHANWGVLAFSLNRGEILYSHNAHRLLVPASNQKLFTTAVGLARLGPQFRFTTRLVATGPINDAGQLEGDLVVIGSGDPTINPRHPERWRAFDDWAKALAARGIRVVNGHLVGDDNAWVEPGWGQGWAWDDLQQGYGAPASALQYHENQVEVTIGPGIEPGARAIVSTAPLGSGLIIDHGVTTGPAGSETRLTLEREPGTIFLTVRGSIAVDAKPRVSMAAAPNPTRMYVNALREALARHGIFVAGSAIDIDELQRPPDLSRAAELIVDQSPPLVEIVDVTNKWSRNIYAESILYAMAPRGLPATADGGLEAMRETLRLWGVPPNSYSARDGSGLSRYDLASPNAFAWLLTYTYLDPFLARDFRASLPEAGVSGSLDDRMKGTPAQARVFAKTGSMTGVRGLSGYLTTLDGEEVVFSLLANGYVVAGREIDRVMDAALERLVTFRRAPAR